MNDFRSQRDGVVHVDVSSPKDVAEIRPSEGVNVYWYGQRPVGHVFVRGEKIFSSRISHIDDDFLSRIDAEVQRPCPALSISVVVCTRDRPEELKRCLVSIKSQSVVPQQIIVIDNASRDNRTKEIALEIGVTYVREDRPGLDIARN